MPYIALMLVYLAISLGLADQNFSQNHAEDAIKAARLMLQVNIFAYFAPKYRLLKP